MNKVPNQSRSIRRQLDRLTRRQRVNTSGGVGAPKHREPIPSQRAVRPGLTRA